MDRTAVARSSQELDTEEALDIVEEMKFTLSPQLQCMKEVDDDDDSFLMQKK